MSVLEKRTRPPVSYLFGSTTILKLLPVPVVAGVIQ